MKKEKIDELSKEEIRALKEKYRKLRKVATLRKIPYKKWKKKELLDLIEEYDFYLIMQKLLNGSEIFLISDFVKKGEYERSSLSEEFRK